MTKPHDIDLMQHADGELDAASEREVEAYLRDGDAGEEARAKVEAVGHVGEVVRGHLELTTDVVPEARFAAMWSEIDKQLTLGATEPATVPVTSATPAQPAEAAAGTWTAMTRWLDRKLGYILTGVASAGAVAAIALVMGRGDGLDPTNPTAPIGPIPVVHRPAEIESLETPGGTPTVLRLQDEDGDTTVIWVTPDDIEGT
jgi:hypothetical protein